MRSLDFGPGDDASFVFLLAVALETAKVKLLGRYLWPDRLEGVTGKCSSQIDPYAWNVESQSPINN